MLRFLAAVGRFLVAIFALIIIVLAAGAGWVLAIIWYPDIDLPRTETAREIASVVGAVCGVILAGSIFGLAAAIYDMKAAPEHRMNPANPNVDIVSFGLRIVFHDAAQPIRWTTPRPFLAPGLKCSPYRSGRHHR